MRATSCLRVASLMPFVKNAEELNPRHDCCSNCAVSCECGERCNLPSFEQNITKPNKQLDTSMRTRQVTPVKICDLTVALMELKCRLQKDSTLKIRGIVTL